MVGRERLVGEAEVHGAETAAGVRARGDGPGVGDEGLEGVGPYEVADLARPRLAHLRAAALDEGPVEVDGVGELTHAAPGYDLRSWSRKGPHTAILVTTGEVQAAGRRYPETRDRAAVPRVRRRQPLLRGTRRVHPVRRAGDAAALRAVVQDQRAQVPPRRRPAQPRGR